MNSQTNRSILLIAILHYWSHFILQLLSTAICLSNIKLPRRDRTTTKLSMLKQQRKFLLYLDSQILSKSWTRFVCLFVGITTPMLSGGFCKLFPRIYDHTKWSIVPPLSLKLPYLDHTSPFLKGQCRWSLSLAFQLWPFHLEWSPLRVQICSRV